MSQISHRGIRYEGFIWAILHQQYLHKHRLTLFLPLFEETEWSMAVRAPEIYPYFAPLSTITPTTQPGQLVSSCNHTICSNDIIQSTQTTCGWCYSYIAPPPSSWRCEEPERDSRSNRRDWKVFKILAKLKTLNLFRGHRSTYSTTPTPLQQQRIRGRQITHAISIHLPPSTM